MANCDTDEMTSCIDGRIDKSSRSYDSAAFERPITNDSSVFVQHCQ